MEEGASLLSQEKPAIRLKQGKALRVGGVATNTSIDEPVLPQVWSWHPGAC